MVHDQRVACRQADGPAGSAGTTRPRMDRRTCSWRSPTVLALLRPDRAPNERLDHARPRRAHRSLDLRHVHRGSRSRVAHAGAMVVYFVGLLVFAALLMSRNPLFFIFAITGFFHAVAAAAVAAGDPRRLRDVDARSTCSSPASRGRPSTCGSCSWRSSSSRPSRSASARCSASGSPSSARSAGRRRRARGGARGERGAPAAARRAGARGGRARRARADGARDPRHDRPRPDRDRHPARGGRAGRRATGRLDAATSTTRSGSPARA